MPPIREYIGEGAGATLGYMLGNVPGAYLGYKVGKRAAESYPKMAKRKTPATPPKTPTKYRRTRKGKAPMRKNPKNVGTMYTQRARTGATTRLASRRTYKKPFFKKPFVPKVSNSLRKKIEHVSELNEVKHAGSYYCYNSALCFRPIASDKRQWVTYPGHTLQDGTNAFSNFNCGELFSANRVLDACSKLYNGKGDTEEPTFFDGANFTPRTFFCDVVYQKVKFWLKNNSNRTYTVRLYVCKAKKTNASNTAGNANPLEIFSDLTTEYTTGTIASYNGFTTNLVNANRMETEYKNDPRFYPIWNEFWEAKTVDFVIEPGQTSTHTEYGPTGPMNMQDYLLPDTSYNTAHKGAVFTMWSVMQDPVQIADTNATGEATLGRVNYFTPPTVTGKITGCLILESERTCKVKIPEKTLQGFKSPANNVTDDEVKERNLVVSPRIYYEQYFPDITGTKTTQRIDEEQPLGA
jgi:hypothetical protein